MKFFEEHSHNFGKQVIEGKGIYDEIIKSLDVPEIGAYSGATTQYKQEVENNFTRRGWVINPVVNKEYSLTINAMKSKIGLTVQTGNIARAFYDLLKFQSMYINDRIDSCVLVIPTIGASKALGSNIANYTRVKSEIALYKHIITVPCLIIGIDE